MSKRKNWQADGLTHSQRVTYEKQIELGLGQSQTYIRPVVGLIATPRAAYKDGTCSTCGEIFREGEMISLELTEAGWLVHHVGRCTEQVEDENTKRRWKDKSFIAGFDGDECPRCYGQIRKGERVRFVPEGLVHHHHALAAKAEHPVCQTCWLTHPEGDCDR